MRRFAALAVVLVVGDPSPADACSLPPCLPGAFVPASSSTVPANLPAVYWRPRYDTLWKTTFDITKLEFFSSAGAVPGFTITQDPAFNRPSFIVSLAAPLVEGATYALVDSNECAFFEPPSATFVAGPQAALPTTLGTLTSATPSIAVQRHACEDTSFEVAQVVVRLELSSDAAPWQDVLHFRTLVDGEGWSYGWSVENFDPPGFAGYTRRSDLIYALCGTGSDYLTGVGTGVHEVKMRATVPGTDLVLETPPITIDLQCLPDPTLPDPPPSIDDGCATTSPSSGVFAALLLLLLRRRKRRRDEHTHVGTLAALANDNAA